MGVLDDAIREHLDLKRRRGADPEEIERAEREALGPIRRSPQEADDPEALGHEEEVLYEQEDELGWEEPGEASLEEPLSRFSSPQDPIFDHARPEEQPTTVRPAEASAPVEEPEAPPEERHAGHETVEYSVEDAGAGEPTKQEDVLEETPDFLQDTPDHDRLWFEQRPPKDFDLGN
jgi:hypothetical protein